MIFSATGLPGAFVVDVEPVADERGFFARTFCRQTFGAHGLETAFEQHSLSRNTRRATLRGLHFQAEPHGETKIVRCTRGVVYDVIVDLRPTSPAYCRWFGVELSGESGRALYIPRGLAHGFITLSDDCDVAYVISTAYRADHARGVRWNDPAFGIEWPLEPAVMSARDAAHPDFRR